MMNLCHQFSVYQEQIRTLLAIIFTMVAFSKVAKKNRTESAYTSVVGVCLLVLANIILAGPIGHVIDAVHNSNDFLNCVSGAVIAAVIITALLMLVGKLLKVKAMPPKTLFICFLIGVGLANIIAVATGNHCAASSKAAKSSK